MLATIILAIGGLLLAALFYLVWYFAKLVIEPNTYSRDYAMAYDLEKGKFNEGTWLALKKEPFTLRTHQGYDLSGYYIHQEKFEKPKGVAVICHGITWNLVGSIKYLNLFYDWGLDVVIYDHRNHGESGGLLTSFGAFEVKDLNQVLDYVEERNGKDTWIVTHGESMGAAIVLQQLATDKRVKACVADCGFSDLSKLLSYRLNESYPWLKFPIILLVRQYILLRAKFDIGAISPISAAENTQIPILWIHGEADDYIPPEMSVAMYEAKKGMKHLLLVPDARHAGAYVTDPKLYKATVDAFLEPLLEACNESSS